MAEKQKPKKKPKRKDKPVRKEADTKMAKRMEGYPDRMMRRYLTK